MDPIILIVEDEPSIADNISYVLETEGFIPRWSNTVASARETLDSETIALIILDVGLPDMNGMEFCKELRKTSSIPVIFLTARSDEIDRIVGLEIGADDYVTKPFSPRELAARVKAVLRRYAPPDTDSSTVASETIPQGKSFVINEEKHEITYHGQRLQLSRYEYLMLKLLVEHPGRVYSRRQMMNQVWEEPDMSMERTVDTHVKTIRAKLKAIDPKKDAILTHRGFGYALAENL